MRISLLVVFAALLSSACSTPLASRRAQVLEKGEAEFIAVPAAVVIASPGVEGFGGLPHVEGSVRFGIFERTDVQLKIDEALFPELSFGYQILGDPHVNEFAMTVTAGSKVAVLPTTFGVAVLPTTFGTVGNVSVPLQLLFDIPITDEGALYFGTRTILGAVFYVGGGGGAAGLAVTPGVVVGASIPFGIFVLQPEVAGNYPLAVPGGQSKRGYVAIGLGLGARFDLSTMRSAK